MIELSIVIVNYNTREYTAQCIDSIFQNPPQRSYEIVLVDNASSDGSADWLADHYPTVKLIRSPKNTGIAGGNNDGIRVSKGRYVLLLNNDTLVLPHVLDRAVCFLDQQPEAGGIGGQLLNPDGSFQSSYVGFASLWQVFLITTKLGLLARPYYPSYGPTEEIREVDWMSTAFMLFRREALEQVGLVDEEFFIYSDEPDLEYRLRQAGWKILYSPDIQTIHFGGKSLTPWRRRRMVYRGYLLFFTRHHTRIEVILLRIMFAVASLIKVPFWAMVSLAPAWRARAREELESHRAIFQMAIRPGVVSPEGVSPQSKGVVRANESRNMSSTQCGTGTSRHLDEWPITLARVFLPRPLVSFNADTDLNVHMEGAIQWILQANQSGRDGGIPAHFDLLRGYWTASYPETTGYTIPTLLATSTHLRLPQLRSLAISLADYLLAVRGTEGGVEHWGEINSLPGYPIVFDTGQVIFGWLAAWKESSNPAYFQAALKAGDWLVSVQDKNGAWVRHQHLDVTKTIDSRVAWALIELAQATSKPEYIGAARLNLEWVLGQQEPNGWFRNTSFLRGTSPYTHSVAYTAEGLCESGLLLAEPRYISAAEKVARVLLEKQHSDGSLSSTYDSQWRPTSRSSCLTGNCQFALLWLRFYGLSRDLRYLQAARKAIGFVAATQDLRTTNPCIRGAIAGSYPIYGSYERLKYPNWAAKFFIDAVLALKKANDQV